MKRMGDKLPKTTVVFQDNDAIWQALMNAAHESLVLIDSSGKILLSNETGARRLGRTVDQFVGTCLYDHFPPDVAKSRKNEWDKVFATGEAAHFEDTRAGLSFELYCYPVLSANEDVTKAAIFARDITESRQAQGLLQKERETFFSILQKAPYGIFVNDDKGSFIIVNPEATNITGYAMEDIPDGKTWFSKAYPDAKYRSSVIGIWKKDVTKRGVDRTFCVCCKTGMVKELEFRAAKLPDGTSMTMFSDTTERRKAERALLRSEEKYRGIFENAIMGIFQTTPDGRYLSINPAGARMYGYASPEDMMASIDDLTCQLYVIPDDRARLKELVHSREIVEHFEVEHYRKDRSKIWASINIRAVRGPDGKMLRYDSTIEDITERKRLESRLTQAEKMQALGTLSGGIAHDFNNILTVLQGYGSLLQKNMDASDPLRLYVDQILSASRKAASLTQSLLAFSRQQPITLAPININEIILRTEKLLKRLVTDDVDLKTVYSESDIIVEADPTQIDQILFNLAANARDAMVNGGCLSIRTECIMVDDTFIRDHGFGKPGQYALISVSDTGCGMSEETRAKIFEPFFTTKEIGKGTGLGLSTVYGIIKQHGGYIGLVTELGKGTRFDIYLPTVRISIEPEKESSETFITKGTEKILVADDDEDVKNLMADILREDGYKIIEASDGDEAVQQFRQNPGIDLVILDSVMPKLNGREAYERIRTMKPAIKVLFTSGYTRDVILDKGIKAKEFQFIAKPLVPVRLLQKVRQIFDEP
ncbi:MAG: PAS domain S-box protein [Syntrophorhabdaceae bacterium]